MRLLNVVVAIPCHDDAEYLRRSIESCRAATSGLDARIVVVADRCSDDTAHLAVSMGCDVIVKERTSWRNSVAENFNLAFGYFVAAGSDVVPQPAFEYYTTTGADVVLHPAFVRDGIRELEAQRGVSSVSTYVLHEPSSTFNRFYEAYRTVMARFGAGRHVSGVRVYRAMDMPPGPFRDVMAEDVELDQRLPGRAVLLPLNSMHIRHSGVRKSLLGQFVSGRARGELRRPVRSVASELIRLRPFVLVGYSLGRLTPRT